MLRATSWHAGFTRSALLIGAFVLPAVARGQFSSLRMVTDGSGRSTQTATGIDVANNAYISSVLDESISVRIIGPNLDVNVPIQAIGTGQGDPDFATTSGGVTYMSFSQFKDASPGEGREIYLMKNPGGVFEPPVNVSRNRVDDFAPKLVLDEEGRPHLAWAQGIQDETRVMYWTEGDGGQEAEPGAGFVAAGDYPALFVDASGIVHIVYSRANDILYNSNAGGAFSNERAITTTPTEPESSASIGGDLRGNIVICYESRRTLYYATQGADLRFRSRLIDTGGIQDPRLRVRSQGQISIVYLKMGDIFYVSGVPAFLNQPQVLVESPEVESHPSMEVDLSGNLHLSFIRNGDVYYTNNAAAPTADFSAEPTQGEVPLTVRFSDLSNGDIQVWDWDFGDGGRASVPHPTHTYEVPGKYTVSLKVAGPGAIESRNEKKDFIFVQTPSNTLRIPDQKVYPGQTDVWFPALGSHLEPLQAFQVMFTYDPGILILKDYSLHETAILSLDPEFVHAKLDGGTFFEGAAIFEINEPIEDVVLPPGQNQTLMNIIFDVSVDAPIGGITLVEPVNNRALSQVFNMFTINAYSQFPALTPSIVRIVAPGETGLFLRGDVDGNGTIDISDGITILNYLFLGGAAPACLDASDLADTGRIDISSPISLLNYLFLGGSSPAVPFPLPGLDPSDDPLGDCAP